MDKNIYFDESFSITLNEMNSMACFKGRGDFSFSCLKAFFDIHEMKYTYILSSNDIKTVKPWEIHTTVYFAQNNIKDNNKHMNCIFNLLKILCKHLKSRNMLHFNLTILDSDFLNEFIELLKSLKAINQDLVYSMVINKETILAINQQNYKFIESLFGINQCVSLGVPHILFEKIVEMKNLSSTQNKIDSIYELEDQGNSYYNKKDTQFLSKLKRKPQSYKRKTFKQ